MNEPELWGTDGPCADCGRPSPVWSADSALWNEIMGTPGNPRGEGNVLCPTCFMYRADAPKRIFDVRVREAAISAPPVPHPAYTRERCVLVRPSSRFGRWHLRLTTEGDHAITLINRSDLGLPGAWTQRGAERKAARYLRRLRRKAGRYEMWCVDTTEVPDDGE